MSTETRITLTVVGVGFTLILALPYVLHFKGWQNAQPRLRYALSWWKLAALTLLMLEFSALAWLLLAAVALSLRPPWHPSEVVVLPVILLLAVVVGRAAFIQAWLHVTYWRHERQTRLVLDPITQTAVYTNAGYSVRFALADLVSVTRYECYRRRQLGGRRWVHYVIGQEYHYQIWALRDGTELVLTCLLYPFTEPAELRPQVRAARYYRVRPRVCWLPGDPLLTWAGSDLFYF